MCYIQVCINYRRISLRRNLSRKCCKIVKFLSITHSESSWNTSCLDGSSGWSFCTSYSLYGYNCSRFHRIFLTVGSSIFNSRLALRIDFLGLRVKVSRTLSTVSSVNTAIRNITQDMLERVWWEWEYRLDICRVTCGVHIECI